MVCKIAEDSASYVYLILIIFGNSESSYFKGQAEGEEAN